MKFLKLILLSIIVTLGGLFASCEETAIVDEYAEWEVRNIAYIDSIAKVAAENADGKWMRILSYKLDSIDVDHKPVEYGNEDYIYCHIEKEGDGSVHPLYTDFVSVNYRGRLIPTLSNAQGKVFDESYKGGFNPAFNKPANFYVDGLIVGWSTALMHMVEGDNWRIYIPSNLGYGVRDNGDIPAYSTLIFDVNLVNISSQ